MRSPAGAAIGIAAVQIAVAQGAQTLARLLRQILEPLHREYLVEQFGQHRSLVAAAGTDLQHLAARRGAGCNFQQQLGHQGHDVGLRDGLLQADRQRLVLVGLAFPGRVDELVARQPANHPEHALVGDALAAQLLDQFGAAGRRNQAHIGGGAARTGFDHSAVAQALSRSSAL
jgi:hypothetical protein